MIDAHCHLEQKDYDKDRDGVIAQCRKKLKAVVTCCADPREWKITQDILKKNKGFVYAIAGIHPEFIKEMSRDEIVGFIKVIEKEAKSGNLVGVGEVGLDYYWIKEPVLRAKQKELFFKFIELAKQLDMPLIVHSREAVLDCVVMLEEHEMKGKKVLMHLMQDKNLLDRIIGNGWMISIGPGILKSKTTRKIARDCPLQNLMLETDSPWFGQGGRGTPLNVFETAEKIAEIKKISLSGLEKQTDLNTERFFGLRK